MDSEVLIINYHHIDDGSKSNLNKFEKIYSVKKGLFEKQLKFVADKNIPVVNLDDISSNNIQHPFSLAFTVDDGRDTDYSIIYPTLNYLKLKCAFFLISEKENNWPAIVEMHRNGFIIGSHGVTHSDLTRLSKSEIIKELKKSKSRIEEMLLDKVNYFSLPYGMYNKFILTKAHELGYKALFTTDFNINYSNKDNFLLHRWSVNRNISFQKFCDIITKKSATKKKIFISNIKITIKNIIGKKGSDQFNLLLNSNSK